MIPRVGPRPQMTCRAPNGGSLPSQNRLPSRVDLLNPCHDKPRAATIPRRDFQVKVLKNLPEKKEVKKYEPEMMSPESARKAEEDTRKRYQALPPNKWPVTFISLEEQNARAEENFNKATAEAKYLFPDS